MSKKEKFASVFMMTGFSLLIVSALYTMLKIRPDYIFMLQNAIQNILK